MFLRLFSDLHLEFGPFEIPALDTDPDTILVLAGDIGVASKPTTYADFIIEAASRFRHVIYIMGNHEHYHGSIQRSITKVKRAIGDLPNVSVINNETLVFDECNTAFVCSTLWTDFAGGNPLAMMQVQQALNDYRLIRTGPPGQPYQRPITAQDTFVEHQIAVKYITEAVVEQKEAGRQVVVVTHHGPSHQSVHDDYRGDPINAGYVSPLDRLIEHLAPVYWCHGHVHQGMDYNIGDTNVIANPRGYVPYEKVRGFENDWVITL